MCVFSERVYTLRDVSKINTFILFADDTSQPQQPKAGAPNEGIYVPVLPDIPSMPSVPTGNDSVAAGSQSGATDDLDFDDLTKRFEALKKKK